MFEIILFVDGPALSVGDTLDISILLADFIANATTRSLNISLDCSKSEATLNLLHTLERIPSRSMLEHLKLHLITHDDRTEIYHQICQDVNSYMQQINSNQSTEGILNPLVVSISILEESTYEDMPALKIY